MKKFYNTKAIIIFLFAFLLLKAGVTIAQVAIDATSPDPLAQLDLRSTNKGFLPHRMTQTQHNDSGLSGEILEKKGASLTKSASITGTNYYVSAKNGSDSYSGTESQPWQTLTPVNNKMNSNNPFQPGDSILFERGSWFFGTIEIKCSGTDSNPVVFGAYGTGSKPVFIYAKQENQLSDWSLVAGRPNVWENRDLTFYVDVANLVFSPGPTFGRKLMNASSVSLTEQGQFWYDFGNKKILIYSVGNPASVYSNIQCVLNRNAIDFSRYEDDLVGSTHIVFENLAFRYYGRCVVESLGSYCSYKNLDIRYIGGADQFGDTEKKPYVSRFGNGLQMWNGVHDVTITGCRIDNVYDAGISPQGMSDDPYEVYNIFIKNNVISNCEFSFEFFERGKDLINNNINTREIYFENNTCINAGKGWSHNQRWGLTWSKEKQADISAPNPKGTHFRFENLQGTTSNIFIRNNIFYGATDVLFWMIFPDAVINNNNVTIDYNCFCKDNTDEYNEYLGVFRDSTIYSKAWGYRYFKTLIEWQAATNKESNSIYGDPLFVSTTDFHLQSGSPLIGQGIDLGNGKYIGAFWPYNFYNGDITLSSQAEVDSFNYQGVTGNLTVRGSNITDLTPLTDLVYIGGNLAIWENVSLTNLDGLQNLTTIGGELDIKYNHSLTSLDSLRNLISVGSNLYIWYNALSNLGGLQNLTSVDGYVNIFWNDSLTDLDGLQNLTSIGEDMTIEYNSSLTSLDGLNSLTSIGGSLVINENVILEDIDSLQNLTSVGGGVVILNNDLLDNLNGLGKLTSVGSVAWLVGEDEWGHPITINASIVIDKNSSLDTQTDFCGLYTLLSGGELPGEFLVYYGNGVKLTKEDIINGGPCGTIYDGDLTLSSQAEVNEFHYIEITGSLIIGGNITTYSSDITDLSPLLGLSSVGGSLRIEYNNELTSLAGLQNLSSVGETYFWGDGLIYSLRIIGNSSLTSLDGLQNLTSFEGELNIYYNGILTSLNGLQNLTSIGGGVKIIENYSLDNLDGLKNLASVGDDIKIEENNSLDNLDGLQNLISVGSYPEFIGVDENGQPQFIDISIAIRRNISLISFCGLYILINGDGLTGAYSVFYNAINPTQQQIINGVPSVAAISTPSAICAGDHLYLSVPAVAANASVITTEGWQLETAVDGGIFENLTVSYTFADEDNGKKIQYYATNYCGTTYSNQVEITVNPLQVINLTSAVGSDAQIVDVNTQIVDITYGISGGASNATVSGLPAGVSYSVNSGVITISGAPSVNSSYTVTTSGNSCPVATILGAITVKQVNPTATLGNKEVYSGTTTAANRRAMPVTFNEAGLIQSISIYHNGGTGNVLLGVYSDQPGFPSTLLGVTASTVIHTTAGWQTVSLTSPVNVTSGQKVWLAWVFQNSPGVRYMAGTPGRAQSTATWSGGMPATFGAATIAGNKFSIYCTYTPGYIPTTATLGNKEVYSGTTTAANRRAMPVTFNEAGLIQSISIYHNGGTGNVLLGVYSDQAGLPSTQLGITAATIINTTAGWQTVPLTSPVNVTSGQKVWLAWVFQNSPGVRYMAGTPGRAQSTATWSGGMPATFGAATIAGNKFSIYCTYTPGYIPTTATLGNKEVYSGTTTAANRRALPVTFNEAGSIQSISIYHNGGTGNVLLGVYSDQAGLPSTQLGITASTVINTTAGWQTVLLMSPVNVTSGQKVWLAWIFQNSPGVRYMAGTPGRAQSMSTWSGGMPMIFGTSTVAGNKFSIYCTYISGGGDEPKSANILLGADSFHSNNIGVLIYPNPTQGNVTIELTNSDDKRMILTLYTILGNPVKEVQIELGNKLLKVDLGDIQNGVYLVELKDVMNGRIISTSRIVKIY